MLGRTLDGRFTILAKLGAGSMGTVYRARQHAIGRDVAIKILRSDRATDTTAKARFLREARANSLLASPHTVTVFDFGQSESGEFYLAMELLNGESLGQRLQRMKRLPIDMAIETARQALRSLAEAHAKGIIHRDLKPDNLFYARLQQGQHAQVAELVKILDFGIAKMMQGEDASPLNAVETQAGTVFGTPRYMSPEQAQGKPLDARSDLYSLAVILYQMITGRPPFTDNDAIVVMARHIKTNPKPPTEACPDANISHELEATLMRALSKDPSNRPSNAEQMSLELARALDVSAAITSGVRSVQPAQILPAGGPPPPILPFPSAASPAQAGAPFDGIASETLAEPPMAPPRRRPLRVMVFMILLALVVVMGAVTVKRRAAPVSMDPPLSEPLPESPAVAPAAEQPVPTAGATAQPPEPPPSAAARPVGTADAPPRPGRSRGNGGRPRATPKAAPPPPPASPPPAPAPPPPSPSSHYGIFE